MITNIRVRVPSMTLDQLKAQLAVILSNGQTVSASVTADISDLIPWFNLCSAETADFALISFFIYGIDRLVPRRANSVDGWSREIKVDLPVYSVNKWQSVKKQLDDLLSFLTGDYWNTSFYKNSLKLPQKQLDQLYNQQFPQVNLFSGGLDSLVGAIDVLERVKQPVLYISHYDPTMRGPLNDQQELEKKLVDKYKKLFVRLPSVKVFLSENSSGQSETTSRSRSILFIGLAALLAQAKGIEIIVPENGTVSVNYPLSPSRRSACSTRTTHPTLLNFIADLWNSLGINLTVTNPYRFKTKGEMVVECANAAFLSSISNMSNSCGKRGHRAHWDKSGTHCGICMPCIYRRASLEGVADTTEYGNSINDLKFLRKKGQDVSALLDFLKSPISRNDIKFEIISNGIRDLICLSDYVELIQRTRDELARWVRREGNEQVRSKAGL
jgi:7-cyano-7-deazaguanine synthase in queuosine biosynthesis